MIQVTGISENAGHLVGESMHHALSISQPLKDRLQATGFAGRVLGVHEFACNLADDAGEVIVLVTPAVGVVATSFDGLTAGDPAHADAERLVAGPLEVDLTAAPAWEPRPDWPRLKAARAQVAAGFAAFDEWAPSAVWEGLTHATGADEYPAGKPTFMARLARGQEVYRRLIAAGLGTGDRAALIEGAGLLAGLGPGGTPAGDDFLVGAMAAAWLLGDSADAAAIAEAAAGRTSTLSAAFLRAAGQGELAAPWHALLEALAAGRPERVEKAAMVLEGIGASSGADALDGFILAGRRLLQSDSPG
jgi:hypothetical protein